MNSIQRTLKQANKLRQGYYPTTLLSENKKTCVSINLPIKETCTPTKRCKADCYGKSGHTALLTNIRKQRFMSKYLEKGNIDHLIQECSQFVSVRLNGVGDLNPCHLPAIFSLAGACPQTVFWGHDQEDPHRQPGEWKAPQPLTPDERRCHIAKFSLEV